MRSNRLPRLTFRTRLLLITILPLLAVSALSWLVISFQADRLIRAELATVEKRILAARQAEIRNYISLAQTSIRHLYDAEPAGQEAAQAEVMQILHDMTFGDDGYFFVYDNDGNSLVHPRLPELVGENWWDLQDPNGDYVIRNLIKAAQDGGGFHRYIWNKPTTGQAAEKLGYADYLPKWGWMFGTGLYLDDIENEISILRAQTEENVNQTAIILFALTFVAVLMVSAMLFAIRLSEERFADSKLKDLTRRIVNVQEDERKRVSTELHDGISQLLVGARYSLDLAHAQAPADAPAHTMEKNNEKPEATTTSSPRALIAKSMHVLDNAISEVRRISKDLRPSVLDDLGLAAAIQNLCNDFADQTRLHVEVTATPVGPSLPDGAKTALYRVLQESLTNIAKHAEASRVSVELKRQDGMLVMRIRDNGKGLPSKVRNGGSGSPASTSTDTGLGIRNMMERVESHGGKLVIRPAEFDGITCGTEIYITMPLDLTREDPSAETNLQSTTPQIREAA
ncbi:cache domain-containing protein [Pararhizobium sp. IMCC21322]|uniref:cache domain-containing protein n=1 Tax=Pararhizobium sp. IMCC21322 TaxID=3067903 RepID=UPI002740BB7F|nr:cache domain-containing protein [Pararhizobium sp. IMCC21322]